jgi:Concanavalin A-like lectin/glucanases superfamily
MRPSARSALARLALSTALAVPLLTGCPQLVDADFTTLPSAAPAIRRDAGTAATDASTVSPEGDASRPTRADPSVERAALAAALAHRYGFDGTGALALDAVAGADARLIGTTLTGTGSVALAGSGQYVDLPNGLLSSTDEQTIEAWLIWKGGRAWQRIFDFGSSSAGEDARGNGQTYLFLTPRSANDVMMLGYSAAGYGAEIQLDATGQLQTGVLTQVAVVVDSPTNVLSLYVDGSWNATVPLEGRLSALDDVNSWLGKGQYAFDPTLDATVTEFRLYHRALTSDQVRASYRLGPDASL